MGKVVDVKSDTQTVVNEKRIIYKPEKGELWRKKHADMVVLNEYMEYFESLNGLCRHIVHVQRDVITQIGSNQWVNLSTKEQDQTLNKTLMNSLENASGYDMELEDTCGHMKEWFPRLKSRPVKESRDVLEASNRDSIQSYSELEVQDGFAGPFSWTTRSLQDLTFPPTPIVKPKNAKLENPLQDVKIPEFKSEMKTDGNNNISTLVDLKEQLRRNYEQAQTARKRMKIQNSSKNPEGITKSSPNVKASVGSKLKSLPAGVQQNGVQVLPFSSNNGHTKQLTPPNKLIFSNGHITDTSPISPKSSFEFWSKSPLNKIPTSDDKVPQLSSKRTASISDDAKLLDTSKASPWKDNDDDEDVISDLFRNRTRSGCSGYSKASRQGSRSSWKSLSSPEKTAEDMEKEISKDLSQFLSSHSTKESSNSDADIDILELLKNW